MCLVAFWQLSVKEYDGDDDEWCTISKNNARAYTGIFLLPLFWYTQEK